MWRGLKEGSLKGYNNIKTEGYTGLLKNGIQELVRVKRGRLKRWF